jgi:hypothetical protein
MQEQWFTDQENLKTLVGLQFDHEIYKNHPGVHDSLIENNQNLCVVCYCEFTDDQKADQLACKHQFHETCWQGYLQSSVSDGQSCV